MHRNADSLAAEYGHEADKSLDGPGTPMRLDFRPPGGYLATELRKVTGYDETPRRPRPWAAP